MITRAPLPPLALLAGGLATRLHPITQTIPKAMLEVAGEPFITHQIRQCVREGITELVICGGYLCEQIEAHVGDGRAFGLRVRYSVDWPTLLGTGGALRLALPLLGDEFFVMYGDSYLDVSFGTVYEKFRLSGRPALMTVFRNENRWDVSNIEVRDGEIVRYSKKERTPQMKYIDYGLGLLSANAFEGWAAGLAFDLAELYGRLIQDHKVAAFQAYSRFYEIGTRSGLEETRAMLDKKPPTR